MVLILSTTAPEKSTETVMDWLDAIGQKYVRFNGEDLLTPSAFTYTLTDEGAARMSLCVDGFTYPLENFACIWFRRPHGFKNILPEGAPDVDSQGGGMLNFLKRELRELQQVFYAAFSGALWLDHPEKVILSKVRVLMKAKKRGLDIPPTAIVSDLKSLTTFEATHGPLITKPLSEVDVFYHQESLYPIYTSPVDVTEDRAFFPSLVQKKIEKQFEVRTFFLDGQFFTMAIFSQADEKTANDFRNYNDEKENRCVPYRLRPEIERKITLLMGDLGLKSGSIDLIVNAEGTHVFLEINPIGQFAMVSDTCNYPIEKNIAQYLARHDRAELVI